MKTLQHETCKKLKEVLGDKAPTSAYRWFRPKFRLGNTERIRIRKWRVIWIKPNNMLPKEWLPAYTVQDVLSRPFLEALGEKLGWDKLRPYAKRTETEQWRYYGEELLSAYWQSQEKFEEELLKLIEKK